MMHPKKHGRMSSVAWLVLLAALAVCYLAIFAGIVGVIGAHGASLAAFGAAMLGCVAAFVYLASALRDVRAEHGMQ
jgi:hypothetical protein